MIEEDFVDAFFQLVEQTQTGTAALQDANGANPLQHLCTNLSRDFDIVVGADTLEFVFVASSGQFESTRRMTWSTIYCSYN